MRTITLQCTGGCGRTQTLNLQDGSTYNGPWTCSIDSPGYKTREEREAERLAAEEAAFDAKVLDAQPRIGANALEIIRRRNQLKNDLEALKQNQPAWWNSVFGSGA